MIKVFLSIALLIVATSVIAGDINGSPIGYHSYKEALNDLKSNPNAKISAHQDWIIIEVSTDTEMTLWSFTPKGHFAHPAVVKRSVIENDGSVNLIMNALCGASKPDCDKLIQQFKQLNEQISQNMRKNS